MTQSVVLLRNDQTSRDVLLETTKVTEDAFFVMNIESVVEQYRAWARRLPDIKPYYAVKCNDSLLVLKLLGGLGANFDCASKGEISKVLSLGIPPSRIIFSNPCKLQSHIKFAAKAGVQLTVFDSIQELLKLKELHPTAELLLRIKADADVVQCPKMGLKFGANPDEALDLLREAIRLELNVVGVSFHVGSGCGDPGAYTDAVRMAGRIFKEAETALNLRLSLVDIGGGFIRDQFDEMADCVLDGILSPPFGPNVKFIAEPGRLFVAEAYELAVRVHSLRKDGALRMYYVNDGVYGSFNNVIMENYIPKPVPCQANKNGRKHLSTVWGPTCDSCDVLVSNIHLPNMEINDWLCFPSMGAYTIPTSTNFNGFPPPSVIYVSPPHIWSQISEMIL